MDNHEEEELPKGWEKRVSRSTGQSYYLNIHTKESQWDVPTEEASSKDNEKIRCSHLLVKHSGSRRPSSWREEVGLKLFVDFCLKHFVCRTSPVQKRKPSRLYVIIKRRSSKGTVH